MQETLNQYLTEGCTLRQLQLLYKVSYRSWKQWLKPLHPQLTGELNNPRLKMTPAKVKIIVTHLEEPDEPPPHPPTPPNPTPNPNH